jgi:hypothetical protein
MFATVPPEIFPDVDCYFRALRLDVLRRYQIGVFRFELPAKHAVNQVWRQNGRAPVHALNA